jgi:hypothetical protein
MVADPTCRSLIEVPSPLSYVTYRVLESREYKVALKNELHQKHGSRDIFIGGFTHDDQSLLFPYLWTTSNKQLTFLTRHPVG